MAVGEECKETFSGFLKASAGETSEIEPSSQLLRRDFGRYSAVSELCSQPLCRYAGPLPAELNSSRNSTPRRHTTSQLRGFPSSSLLEREE